MVNTVEEIMSTKFGKLKRATYALLLLILTVYVLVEARNFLYPIFIAVLFAYLLYPVVKKLETWGVPRVIANLVSIIVALALFITGLVMLYKQLSNFLVDFPSLEEKALRNLDSLQQVIDKKFGEEKPDNNQWLREQVQNAFQLSGNLLKSILVATTGTLTKFGLMPVYIFLLLYYRNKFVNFLMQLLDSSKHAKAKRIIKQISHVTKRYMTGVVLVILILCVINSTGLLLIGIEYAILLGVISAIFNFIPYFGTLIGGAIPVMYTLMVQGSPSKTLAVLGFFLLVQFTENNILTPNITGSKVNINPLFTILSIIVGGMIWGIPGMFVAVPYLGMFKIYCDNQPEMSPYSYLLGTRGTEEHAFTIQKLLKILGIKKS